MSRFLYANYSIAMESTLILNILTTIILWWPLVTALNNLHYTVVIFVLYKKIHSAFSVNNCSITVRRGYYTRWLFKLKWVSNVVAVVMNMVNRHVLQVPWTTKNDSASITAFLLAFQVNRTKTRKHIIFTSKKAHLRIKIHTKHM